MLQINDLSFTYGQIQVLDHINLSIEHGEIICLLGESGSGKTTLLRAIAGLEADYSGRILVEGQPIGEVPVHQRGFGLMFQEFALFPHMTVEKNVAYGLRMQKMDNRKQHARVSAMLSLVGLDDYQSRSVDALSGGQKQRVALARSLAPNPRLLMLDEPLGSLDAGLRERLVVELRQIIKEIGLTAIYVTHDQQEAYAIADRIAIMQNGQIAQYDTPETLYHQPESKFVARFLGLMNIVPAHLLPMTPPFDAPQYLLHPNSITLDETGDLTGTITERVFQGEQYRLKVTLTDDIILTLSVPSQHTIPEMGTKTHLRIDPQALHPIYS